MAGIDTSMYSQQPTTKLDIPGAISAAQGMQSLDASKYALGASQLNQIRSTVGSLAQDPDVTPQKVQAAGQMLVQQGLVPPQMLDSFMQGLQGKTGADLRGALANHLATMIDAHTNYTNAYGGQAGSIDLGDKIVQTRQAPRMGINPIAVATPGMSPNTQSEIVRGPDTATGQQTTESRADQIRRNGGAVPQGTFNALTGPAGSGPAVNPLVGSVVAPAGAGVAMPAAAAPAGPRVMTNAAGSNDARVATAQASAAQGNSLQAEATKAMQMKALLSDLERQAKEVSTGPMSGALRTAGGYINQGAAMMGKGPMVEGQGAREELAKTAARIQALSGSSISGTNEGLSLAAAANPNENYTHEGLMGMTASLKGQADMSVVQNKAWQVYKKKNGPDSFGDFQQEFQRDYSPRVFQIPYMKPDAAKKMLLDLKPDEKAKVIKAYNEAYANGWVAKPGEGK